MPRPPHRLLSRAPQPLSHRPPPLPRLNKRLLPSKGSGHSAARLRSLQRSVPPAPPFCSHDQQAGNSAAEVTTNETSTSSQAVAATAAAGVSASQSKRTESSESQQSSVSFLLSRPPEPIVRKPSRYYEGFVKRYPSLISSLTLTHPTASGMWTTLSMRGSQVSCSSPLS
jgi:hypothetical protein